MKTNFPGVQEMADLSYKGTMRLVEQHNGKEIWHCMTKDFTEYYIVQHSDNWDDFSPVKGDFEHDDYGIYTDKGGKQALEQARQQCKEQGDK